MYHYIVISLPSVISLIWAIIFLTTRSKDDKVRLVLGFFMLTALIVYLSHIPFFLKDFRLFMDGLPIYTISSLLVYPIYYLYISLVVHKSKIRPRELLIFLPALLFGLSMAITITLMDEQQFSIAVNIMKQSYYPKIFWSSNLNNILNILFLLSRIAFATSVILFFIKSSAIIRKYHRNLQNIYAEPQNYKVKCLTCILVILIISSLLSIAFNTIGFQYFFDNDLMLLIPSISLSITLMAIGISGFRQEQVSFIIEKKDSTTAEFDTSSPIYDEIFIQKFENFIFVDREYLRKDLKIWDICEAIGTNRTYVSTFINNRYHKNFCTFINDLRVEYSKELLQNPQLDKYSMNYIAENSGFNSLNSYYRAFSKIYRVSPGKYKKETNLL
jgi:AraC-type DNA-binding domain-containing proteins